MTCTLGSDNDLAQAKCERATHREALTYHAVCLPLKDLAEEGVGFWNHTAPSHKQPATQSSSSIAIINQSIVRFPVSKPDELVSIVDVRFERADLFISPTTHGLNITSSPGEFKEREARIPPDRAHALVWRRSRRCTPRRRRDDDVVATAPRAPCPPGTEGKEVKPSPGTRAFAEERLSHYQTKLRHEIETKHMHTEPVLTVESEMETLLEEVT
ncbi:hypothetical protein CIB48_g11845 [Xylaria polymorpha]|nr:hypothetical protein CIB48_g11845 [Xylaria polymorpha]